MMKKKYRFLSFSIILLALTMQIVFPYEVVAAPLGNEPATKIGLGIDEEEGTIVPYYTVACPKSGSGKHIMAGKGWGVAYKGAYPSKTVGLEGFASQCKHCYLVLIAENNRFFPSVTGMGRYALWNPGYEVATGVAMWTNDYGYSASKTSDFEQGFFFF